MHHESYASSKKGKTGIRRIINACGYSMDGLAAAYRHESAFPPPRCAPPRPAPPPRRPHFELSVRVLLIIASFVSLIVELFNTSIEAAVDHTSTAEHELAKRAKDAGSAAQLAALVMLTAVWVSALWHVYL